MCGSGESEETLRTELRETAFEFSDLLETANREIHLLDKVTVYFQSFFSTLEGLCTVKKIGKLKADKVMLAAKDLDRSCLSLVKIASKIYSKNIFNMLLKLAVFLLNRTEYI